MRGGKKHGTDDDSNDDSTQQSDAKDGVDKLVKNQWIPRSRYKRQQNTIKKQNITVVFNISSIPLTEAMERVLNIGLNFSVLANNIDITQILVDLKIFGRTMVWKEWWFGRESEKEI